MTKQVLDDRAWREAELLSRLMSHAIAALDNNDLPGFRRWAERIREEMEGTRKNP